MCRCTNSFCVRITSTMAFVSPFLAVFGNLCFFSHPTDGFLSEMAIAAVLGGDSNHHEGLRIGSHVRLRNLLGRARATHPRHPSEHRSLGKHLRSNRSKFEHLAARSKHPSCVARVLGALPRDALKSAVDAFRLAFV